MPHGWMRLFMLYSWLHACQCHSRRNLPRYRGTIDKCKTLTRNTDEGGSEDTKMTGRQLYRISGLVLVIGAIAFAVHVVLRSLITAGADPSSFAQQGPWAAINALGLVGAVLVLLGLPAMYARMAA